LNSPITNNTYASRYWGIDGAVQYGGSNGTAPINLLNTTAGIVDAGTSLVYLATRMFETINPRGTQKLINTFSTLDAYNQYVETTGAVLDTQTKLLRITPAQYESLQSLHFVFGDNMFELTPNAQIFSRAHNAPMQGGDQESIYLAVQDVGTSFPPGVDFVCGMLFMDRFYTVFDNGNRRIGFAPTAFTYANTN
jgi:cathepsin E